MSERPLPLIRIGGTPSEMGLEFGRQRKESIRHMVADTRTFLEATYDQIQLTWDDATLQARKYEPYSQEHTPKFLEELRSMARGADVAFEDLMIINCLEAITLDAMHLMKCTSFAVNDEHSLNGHTLVGHNEDWMPEDEDDVVLVHAEPEGEPAFLAMTYGALLPNIGFNAAGIAQCCDSVYPTDVRVGVPRIFVSRQVLAARTISEAIYAALIPQRAAGYNHLIVHSSGEGYNIEVSARHFSMAYSTNGLLVHTNHFLSRHMSRLEKNPDLLISSRVRYFRALRLLRRTPRHDVSSFQRILRDHVNHPNSICSHAVIDDNPLDRQKTICSMVMDLDDLQMHIAWGNPCQAQFYTYPLEP